MSSVRYGRILVNPTFEIISLISGDTDIGKTGKALAADWDPTLIEIDFDVKPRTHSVNAIQGRQVDRVLTNEYDVSNATMIYDGTKLPSMYSEDVEKGTCFLDFTIPKDMLTNKRIAFEFPDGTKRSSVSVSNPTNGGYINLKILSQLCLEYILKKL